VLFEMTSAHEEGGVREYLASTVAFLRDDAGNVRGVQVAETGFVDGKRVPIAGTEREIRADLVLLALGFTGPEDNGVVGELGVDRDHNERFARDSRYASDEPGVFIAGDAGRGQSLIVWAIAEGRAAAAAVDSYLGGHADLPAPVKPHDRGFSVV
jgi:glutamate synthase (NADPH/NADH) small chain